MKSRPGRIAVVTGAHYATSLCAARSLHADGVELIGLCSRRESGTARSKLWNRLVHSDDEPNAALDTLLELGQTLPRRAVLFLSQDELVQVVSDHREALEPFYDFVLPSRETVDKLMKKTLFHEWAARQSFPVPDTSIVRSQAELDCTLDSVRFPVVIKPTVRTPRWNMSTTDKAFILHKRSDINRIGIDLFAATSEVIVQQYIPGGDSNVYFCLSYFDRTGRERGFYTGRKMLQWPLLAGSATIALGEVNEEIHRLTNDVFTATECHGLASLEFKQSTEDGKYYLIEPTIGRNDLFSEVASGGGIDLTLMAFCDAAGEEFPPCRRPRKCIWINEETLPATIKKGGRVSWRDMISLLCIHKRFAYFSLKDPMPFLCLCGGFIRKGFNTAISKFRLLTRGTRIGKTEAAAR